MFILRDGSEPVYRRLADSIKGAIHDGLYHPGDQLPTVRTVAIQLVLNPNTVARAYQVLEQEGVIHTIVGRGSFVAAPPDDVARIQSGIIDGLAQLHRAGWTLLDLEVWCLSAVRDLAREGTTGDTCCVRGHSS